MPVFTNQLKKVDYDNPRKALQEMANHIRYIQEQLEWTLSNLDSSNITEIDTNQTTINSGTGGSSFSGDSLSLKGKNGESFEAGTGENGQFTFSVKGKNGTQMLYLTSDGQLIISNNATMHIDGGEW